VGAVYHSIKGGSLVIAPVRMIGGTSSANGTDEVLARMLQTRLRSIMTDLEQSQTSLRQATEVPGSVDNSRSAPTFLAPPRTVRLDAQLFEPADIEVKVAGVEVSSLLSRLQRWFIQDRTLDFTVSLQEKSAIISGNVDALSNSRAKSIWIHIENPSPEAIVDEIAFALIQRTWANDGREIGELKPEEFRTLVLSVTKVAEINRRVHALNLPARVEYTAVLNDLVPLVERIKNWNELTYFAATIAEGAQDNRRALLLYHRLKESGTSPITADLLDAKLKLSQAAPELAADASLAEYQRLASSTAAVLSRLFGFTLPLPPIELEQADYRNAYWDGEAIHIPPGIEDIPDILIHEVTIPFMQKVWNLKWEVQNGALVVSYTDVLTSIVKQARLHQTAEEADWTIAPGGIAWVAGKSRGGSQDQRPLRSLKAPGTAYDDPEVGKDPQVAHYRDLVTTSQDAGAVHTNSGIPNKAFYETAIKIGTEKAGRIWVESLKQFQTKMDLPKASRTIQATAAQLYGDNSPEAGAVRSAWKAVGL
jgi:thermolysin metallopeptidase-like protein